MASLPSAELHAPPQTEIAALTLDSRTAEEGSLFLAVRGEKADGNAFIAEAAANGAVCTVCDTPPEADVPYVLVPDVRIAASRIACAFFGEPSHRMQVIGVTGTNGKTTTTCLLADLLERCLHTKVGRIGTVENRIGERSLPAGRTTPDALHLQSLLAQMADAGCTHAVMEVSSHALDQHRTDGIRFAVGIFTNLTRDHLDYHGTMERYCDAKARLFADGCAAVVNGDDPWTPRLLRGMNGPRLTFGQDLTNDLVAWHLQYCSDRVTFCVSDDERHLDAAVPLPGEFSVYNALGVLGAAKMLGIPLETAVRELPYCRGAKGRCEVVPLDTPYTVLIDYAHTPDGLQNLLQTVCGFAEGRVITVFGCGGDRDTGKRAQMGRIAALLSDLVIVTSDNPRTEDPYRILHAVVQGMAESSTPFAVLEDRRAAIAHALAAAQPGDVVVLAGKGHETEQIIGTHSRPFDEREIVRELLKDS